MIRINQIKILHDEERHMDNDELRSLLLKKTAKLLRVNTDNIDKLEIMRHSIDARKKPEIYHIYMVDVFLKGLKDEAVLKKCRDKNASVTKKVKYDFVKQIGLDKETLTKKAEDVNSSDKDRIVIVGAGPAGLFAGYMLVQNGFKPLVLERGCDVDKRTEIVEHFWKTGELDTRCNVQFGEGGAGTFSDGKLNTMVKDKDGRGRKALEIFVENGAPIDIMYDAKPHIGTDILRNVVRNMRQQIIKWGGEVRFEACVTDVLLDDNNAVKAVVVNGGETIACSNIILSIGHSARDTFYMLKDRRVDMSPKPFAVGFRVEHPQSLINLSQYGIENPKELSAAPYKLTATTESGRGVYSFCMCPGGYVVNASSEEGRLAVNGMSYSDRAGKNANSAIIITVDPKDFGSDDVLSGVEFQRRLEEKAYNLGKGKIPVEYYGDFKRSVTGDNSEFDDTYKKNEPSMRGDYTFADVHTILSDDLNQAFVEGMEKFGRTIKGYNCDGALVSGVESRTSSPVRINRDENGQSVNIKGIYPCGEGAGYAGGIMSAAMDGMKIAEMVVANI
ncbi:NAD(P)/FAD-dependent oxidoreductase [Butyrivibrio proteoclasticus]|uniref:NAD(P)/FAD-dependent oxidoreductase n=1 Tax=Butyrivibrio proteoclasticus TaxID=43305 RepID=UPI0004787A47|nr:NAD(P)-binding protein [Butyrivibrio proteoclasticus]